MEVYIIAIIFLKSQFSEQFIFDGIKRTEETFPFPHPHPQEKYIRTEVDSDLVIVFYEVDGYGTDSICFEKAVELFREDQFPSILKSCAKERITNFCFYIHIYDGTDDFMISCKYNNQGFDERQSIDGAIMRIVGRDIDGAVKMEDHDAADRKAVRIAVVERFLAEQTGLTQEALIHAWESRHDAGTPIAAYENGIKVK